MTIDFGNLDPSVLTLSSGAQGIEPAHHFVEFYDDDRTLIDSVSTFVSVGLGHGDAAIIIAGPTHRQSIDVELNRSIDLRTARRKDLYVSIDAEETLSLFMDDGLPDPARFDGVLGELIGRVSGRDRNVRVFGEMVALLWEQGNVVGALRLEDHWNRLAQTHPFRLFCAYPARGFGEGDLASLGALFERHSHVVVSKEEAV